jgi:hypothetical protein
MRKFKGSLTIEGAIVLPIIIIFVCAILYFVKILYIQEQVQYAITEAAEEIAANAYILDKAKILDNQQEIYGTANNNIAAYEENIDQIVGNGQAILEAVDTLPSLYYEEKQVLSIEGETSIGSGNSLLAQGAKFLNDLVTLQDKISDFVTSLIENGTSLVEGIEVLVTDAKSYAASLGVGEGLEIVNTLVGTQITKGIVNSYISDEQYDNFGIINGKNGMNYSRSKFMLENEDVLIVVSYQLEVPFFSQFIGEIPMKQSACVRAFTGNENFDSAYQKTAEEVKEEDSVEYVYITQNGKKYHTKDCSCINIEVITGTYGEVKDSLTLCSSCAKDGVVLTDSTVVYYTKTGSVFHTDPNCGYICHTVLKVTKEEAIANGYEPCKICGGGE